MSGKMQDKELDRLFRERLSLHEAEVSSDAWELLQGKMEEKRGFVWWIWAGRIAAGVLLLLVSIYLLRPMFTSYPENAATANLEEKSLKETQSVMPKSNGQLVQAEELEEQKEQTAEEGEVQKPVKTPNSMFASQTKASSKAESGFAQAREQENQEELSEIELPREKILIAQVEPLRDESLQAFTESMTTSEDDIMADFKLSITYKQSEKTTIANLDEQFLKSDTRLKKIVDMANDIRPSGFSLSKIREFKDELLAIDNIKLNQKKNSK